MYKYHFDQPASKDQIQPLLEKAREGLPAKPVKAKKAAPAASGSSNEPKPVARPAAKSSKPVAKPEEPPEEEEEEPKVAKSESKAKVVKGKAKGKVGSTTFILLHNVPMHFFGSFIFFCQFINSSSLLFFFKFCIFHPQF